GRAGARKHAALVKCHLALVAARERAVLVSDPGGELARPRRPVLIAASPDRPVLATDRAQILPGLFHASASRSRWICRACSRARSRRQSTSVGGRQSAR